MKRYLVKVNNMNDNIETELKRLGKIEVVSKLLRIYLLSTLYYEEVFKIPGIEYVKEENEGRLMTREIACVL